MKNQKVSTNEHEYSFSKEEIDGFIKTKEDFLDGKTTARDWTEIAEELNHKYAVNLPEKSK